VQPKKVLDAFVNIVNNSLKIMTKNTKESDSTSS
jgi:hypothetical protein